MLDGTGEQDLARFDAVLVGGGPLDPACAPRRRRAGIRIVQTYGMSETCGGCVYDGLPLDGVEVRIGDDGEVLLRGPMLFDGYEGEPERTAAVLRDGWFHTDDLGELDDDGRLRVTGRRDDVIISGGVKVPGVGRRADDRARTRPSTQRRGGRRARRGVGRAGGRFRRGDRPDELARVGARPGARRASGRPRSWSASRRSRCCPTARSTGSRLKELAVKVFSIPLRTRFRGITVREGVLLEGPAGWGEFSPFLEYDAADVGALAGLRARGGRRRLARRRCAPSYP